MSVASTFEGSPGHHRQPPSSSSSSSYANGGHTDSVTVTTRAGGRHSNSNTASSSSRPAGSRTSGRLTVTDLVESDPDAPSRSLKRKASPERTPATKNNNNNNATVATPTSSSTNDYSVYPNDHVPSKQNRASASPHLSALLNGPSPPLRPTQGSPIANPPPALTPPSTNPASGPPNSAPTTSSAAGNSSTLSPPQPKAVTEIAKASSSSTSKRTSSATSAPASPKPARAVPVAKSGGLLAGAFGDVAIGDDDPEPAVPTVVLHISLNGENNKYIDVSKMAEEKYGWAALNPRLARAKQRLGNDASGDEAMMDASESESAMEEKMGGVSDAGLSGAGGPGEKKRKKRRVDEYYDANDPFIDDSEMLWEEQAAASKDGFFVYSGPLVPEGERPQIERANGGPPKRGRGRGGRGGGTGRGGANAGKAAAPRKPRVTKAVKEKMEREKEEREKAGLALQAPRSIPA